MQDRSRSHLRADIYLPPCRVGASGILQSWGLTWGWMITRADLEASRVENLSSFKGSAGQEPRFRPDCCNTLPQTGRGGVVDRGAVIDGAAESFNRAIKGPSNAASVRRLAFFFSVPPKRRQRPSGNLSKPPVRNGPGSSSRTVLRTVSHPRPPSHPLSRPPNSRSPGGPG